MPEITWTNCFLRMPRKWDKVIIKGGMGGKTKLLGFDLIKVEREKRASIEWTPYTDEKWKELNK